MTKGFLRLGVLLTVLWAASVGGLVVYEYYDRTRWCSGPPPTTPLDDTCFIYWRSAADPNTEPNVAPWEAFKLRNGRLALHLLGVPAAVWLIALGIAWVARGFRSEQAT